MMDIKEEQIFEYIKCPVYFDLKNNKNIKITERSMQKYMNEIMNYFYSNLFQGKVCTINMLKNKWDKICEKNRDMISNKKNLEGLNYIINFVRWISDYQPNIIGYETFFETHFNNIRLTGSLGVVNKIDNKNYELIINRFGIRTPTQIEIDKNLKYTIDCYILNKEFSKCNIAIKLINHKNNTEFTSYRTNNDFDRLNTIVLNVAKAIDNKIYYPRENYYCSSCIYKDYCKYWY